MSPPVFNVFLWWNLFAYWLSFGKHIYSLGGKSRLSQQESRAFIRKSEDTSSRRIGGRGTNNSQGRGRGRAGQLVLSALPHVAKEGKTSIWPLRELTIHNQTAGDDPPPSKEGRKQFAKEDPERYEYRVVLGPHVLALVPAGRKTNAEYA